jgi:hypothetical protein
MSAKLSNRWRSLTEEEATKENNEMSSVGSEYQDWDGEIDLSNPLSGRRLVEKTSTEKQRRLRDIKKRAKGRPPKAETGTEWKERINENRRKKEVKKAISSGRKMRKEGQVRSIMTYFKK